MAEGTYKTAKKPQNPEQHSAVMMRLYKVCHWHSPVRKQKEVAAGAAAESQGYSSVSSVHEDALSLYPSKVACRLKNCKKEGDFFDKKSDEQVEV